MANYYELILYDTVMTSSRLYWFLGIDDRYDFKLLQVALYSAFMNTSLVPIVLYTSLSKEKLSYLDVKGVKTFKVNICPDLIYADSFPGALLRLYIPKIASRLQITGIVLYTDCDVLFLSDPPKLDVYQIAAASYFPYIAPSTSIELSNCSHWEQLFEGYGSMVNSGVLYINVDNLFDSNDYLLQLGCIAKYNNAPAESIYHYYDIEQLSYKLNYFAYWDNHLAKCNTNKLDKPIILHFHGPKPNISNKVKELQTLYTHEFTKNTALWHEYALSCFYN